MDTKIDYEKLYHVMVHGAELALQAIEAGNGEFARMALIDAEQHAERLYLQTEDTAEDQKGDLMVG